MIEELKKLGCNCYVAHLKHDKQFTLRWGAHETTCPVYRPSLDPVNQKQDDEIRERHLTLLRLLKRRTEHKGYTIIRLPQYGAALVAINGLLYYGPQNADGSVKFNEDEFILIQPEDISIAQEVGTPMMLRRQAD